MHTINCFLTIDDEIDHLESQFADSGFSAFTIIERSEMLERLETLRKQKMLIGKINELCACCNAEA